MNLSPRQIVNQLDKYIIGQDEAKKAGATVILGEKYLEDLAEDVLIRSPGIRPDIEAFRRAKKSGSRITCETELFLRFSVCIEKGRPFRVALVLRG